MNSSRTLLLAALLPFVLLADTGCGLLFGTVKPVDEKSDQYGVMDLSKENPAVWTRLNATEEGGDVKHPETTATEISDVAFQSKKTAAIVSLNSSCRPNADNQNADLRTLTDPLLLGISNVAQRVEKNMTIQSTPALETTVEGQVNGQDISLRSVVLRRNSCVYDLLYMAPPAHFASNEADFSHFVASLRLK
jgi:hypothetical protein